MYGIYVCPTKAEIWGCVCVFISVCAYVVRRCAHTLIVPFWHNVPPPPTSWPYANSLCCTLSCCYQPCNRIAACAAQMTQIDGAAILMHLLYVAKWNIYYSETERASTRTAESQRNGGSCIRNGVKHLGGTAMVTVIGSARELFTLEGLASCCLSTPEQWSESLCLETDAKLCSFSRVVVQPEPPWLTLSSCDRPSGFPFKSPSLIVYPTLYSCRDFMACGDRLTLTQMKSKGTVQWPHWCWLTQEQG